MDSIFRSLPSFSPLTFTLLIGIVLILVYLILTGSWAKYIVSPGPWGIPILGYYPFLPKTKHYLQLIQLAEKYGDAYLVNICGKVYVHISSYSAVKEAFVTKSDCFNMRPQDSSIMFESFKDAVFAKNGDEWRVWRKFVIQSMREVGLGSREQLKGPIQDAIEATLKEIKNNEGKPTNVTSLLTLQCSEVIRRVAIGDNVTKQTIEKFNKTFRALMLPLSSFEALLCGKIARFIARYKGGGASEIPKLRKEMYKIFNNLLKDHETCLNPDDPKDIVDVFIRERQMKEKKKDPAAKYLTTEAFTDTMVQIYGDGGFTVGAFLSGIIFELAKKPDLQESIFLEISENIGTEKLATYEDRTKLPYTNSVLKEILRKSDGFPLFPNMECTASTTISGVYVPKGALALVNTYAINHDTGIYENPEDFNPKRFLPSQETEERKDNSPMVFGLGKRACLGETLVMTELFLFTTAIIQNFKFRLPDANNKCEGKEYLQDKTENTILDEYHVIMLSRT